ncbi:MAG: hypothetical protein AAFP03_09500 [Cyanobacteria bacterium J06598_3]
MDAAIIRQGELVGRGLIGYETTEEIGSVEHLLVDVQRAQVMGLTYKTTGLIARKQSLNWAQLVKIGRDAIVVHTQDSSAQGQAVEDDQHALTAVLSAAQNMTGLEVWTDGGDHIGQVVDLCLDAKTGEVQQYLFALKVVEDPSAQAADDEVSEADADEGGATVVVYAIAPKTIISAGRKRMMIAEEDAQRAQPYAQPLAMPASTTKKLDWNPEQLPKLPVDFPMDVNELLQKGQFFAGKMTEQVKQRARQFTDEQLAHQDFVDADSLPDISEQLQAKSQQVRKQMQDRFNTVRDSAQDQLDGGLGDRIENTLGKTQLGRSLGKTFDKFKKPHKKNQSDDTNDPIDVESFEVWEED